MTATSQSTRRKLSLLQLAEELGNVSKACKLMGYHRDTFYEVKRAFQIGGVATLVEQKRGPRNPHPNRVAADVEKRILDFSLQQPTRGPQYLANQLRLENVNVSAGGVRGVWLRHDIETRHKRLMRLERHAREKTFVLSEAQIRLLERHSSDFRSRHVEASRPGELLNQDTFYWGTLKGVGKVYVQVIVDVSCSFAFAKVYTSKMPITACDLMHDRVLPFYENLGITVGSVLTDNGREFCGKPEAHPYELLLAVEGIKHRTTKVRSPRTNGFVERMNRTLLDECFRVPGQDQVVHVARRDPGRPRHLHGLLQLPPQPPGLPRPRPDAGQGAVRSHRRAVAAATDVRRGPGGAARQLNRHHAPRTGCRGNTRLVHPGLLATTSERFVLNEVSGDKAYNTKRNLALVVATGATPYIPFKSYSTAETVSGKKGNPLWAKLWHYYEFNREEFLRHYHKRSNAETVFSAVKRKFGSSLRSKLPVAQENEVYCKFIAHNLSCLVHSMYELGIEPKFWAGDAQR